ncbi:hypothetical protein Ciccas_010135 [Cichlidogyrus casuarinus]|uniref:Uncharacterized protein n=1 Tax=Cichlidogyrus casuarinus TaxID=1844966 RepID=A0ABD2PW27_9PLAT
MEVEKRTKLYHLVYYCIIFAFGCVNIAFNPIVELSRNGLVNEDSRLNGAIATCVIGQLLTLAVIGYSIAVFCGKELGKFAHIVGVVLALLALLFFAIETGILTKSPPGVDWEITAACLAGCSALFYVMVAQHF